MQKRKTPKLSPKIVPTELHEYLDVFDKKKAKQFPESWPWDHAIELKEDFLPSDCTVYSLTPLETEEMNKSTNENPAKGYIRFSKLPMASLFFFVNKKDSVQNTRLWPCQDYIKLNVGTIKNTQIERCQVLYQDWSLSQIQQCLDQRWWPMEGSLQKQQRTLQTYGHVLWNV